MGFFDKLKVNREYREAFLIAKMDALDAVEASMLAINNFDTKKEDIFRTYSLLMDLSENYWNRHRRLIDKVNKYSEASVSAKIDAVNFAKIYYSCAKRIALVCTGLSALGGFQPIRCREMLENSAVYPEGLV